MALAAHTTDTQRLQLPVVGLDDVGAPFHHKGPLERSCQPGKMEGEGALFVFVRPPKLARTWPSSSRSFPCSAAGSINTAFAHMC